MTDDISKVELMKCICPADSGCSNRCDRGQIPPLPAATYRVKDGRLESATTPAEVDVPTIDRDEAYQRDYIPLGRSGWEIQTKGKGSTYRICDKDGDRLAIPDTPYLHETLTRMAREVHADYATLARQLAEAERQNKIMREADYHAAGVAQEQEIIELKSQLAAATRRLGEVEGLLRECQRRLGAEETLQHMTYREWSELDDRIDAALTKESTK